jgi:hypothetical protein
MADSYEQLKQIKAYHPMVIANGTTGTQKARVCRWRHRNDGSVDAMVQKWIASHKAWLADPVPHCDRRGPFLASIENSGSLSVAAWDIMRASA